MQVAKSALYVAIISVKLARLLCVQVTLREYELQPEDGQDTSIESGQTSRVRTLTTF